MTVALLPTRATSVVRVGLSYVREPPAEWVARLAEYSPPSEDKPWLKIVWEPGEPWIAGQRWTFYEMTHQSLLDMSNPETWALLDELNGPHPRNEGHICTSIPQSSWPGFVPKKYGPCLCRHKFEGWRFGPCSLITKRQWELWREVPGYLAQRFWVIQGEAGGHKTAFNEQEVDLLKIAGLPEDPPGIGDLPYAPFDERAVAQVIRHNRLHQLNMSYDEYRRTRQGTAYRLEREQLARSMRAEYVKWLAEQLGESTELFISAARKGQIDDHAARTETDFDRAGTDGVEQFIETGQMPDLSTYQ